MKELQSFSMYYTIPTIFSVSIRITIKSAHINFLSCVPMQDQYIAEQGDRY